MRQCRLVWRMEKVRISHSKFLPKYFPNTIQNICPNLKIAKKSLHLLITKVVTKTENHFSWQSQTSLFHHCCSSRSHHQPYLLLLLLHPLLLSSRFPLHHRLSLRHHPLPSDGFKRGNERWLPRHQKLNQWQPIIIRIWVPFHKYFENAVRRILLFEGIWKSYNSYKHPLSNLGSSLFKWNVWGLLWDNLATKISFNWMGICCSNLPPTSFNTFTHFYSFHKQKPLERTRCLWHFHSPLSSSSSSSELSSSSLSLSFFGLAYV